MLLAVPCAGRRDTGLINAASSSASPLLLTWPEPWKKNYFTSFLVISKQYESRPVLCQIKSSAYVVVFSNPRFRLRIYHRRLIELGRFQPAEVVTELIMDPSACWELLKLGFFFKTLVCSQRVALRNSREER